MDIDNGPNVTFNYTSKEGWNEYSKWVSEKLIELFSAIPKNKKTVSAEKFFDNVAKDNANKNDFKLDLECALDILVAYDNGEKAILLAESILCQKIKEQFLRDVG